MNASNSDWEIIEWHAGLLSNADFEHNSNQLKLSEAIWCAKQGQEVNLKNAADHFLFELQKVNMVINGKRPSETIAASSSVPMPLAYAVSLLLSQCIELSLSSKHLIPQGHVINLSWRLSWAWQSLLAGDIDNIIEHVELEAYARGIEK